MDKTAMIDYLKQHHNRDLHNDYQEYVLSFDSFVLQTVQLNSVNSDLCDLCDLDPSKLDEYSQLDCDLAPPIVVGDGYIIDGYHRVRVALESNKSEITAWVGVHG
ncbi:hypothetical protein N9Z41_01145 [bacterium]|nr:hypothetical protein [bacterium]